MVSFKKAIPILFLLLAFSYSCNKSININASWQDITVVFGLINQTESTHYVKINKAFLGEENAYVMAAQIDSSEYESVNAVIEEWKDGSLKRSFLLEETTSIPRDSGVFAYPTQKVYMFQASDLDADARYKLVATIHPGTAKEKEVTAETELINGIIFGKEVQQWKTIDLSMASNGALREPSFSLTSGKDAKRIEVYITFNYTDVVRHSSAPNDTSMIKRQVTMKVAQSKFITTNGGENKNLTINGQSFYQKLAKTFFP
jgi:hypothetical protein